jgi:hypothetical protein
MNVRRKTKPFYYGPPEDPYAFWWDVEWSPATKTVMINGTLEHAIEGVAGDSIGCRLSNAARDIANEKAFPHPVILAAFYKRTALIIDKLAPNGTPIHAVVYQHSYGDLIDLNDLRDMEPIYKDRKFYLRPPLVQKKRAKKATGTEEVNDGGVNDGGVNDGAPQFDPAARPKKPAMFVGAMKRAIKSGKLDQRVADQLTRAIKKKQEHGTDAS